MKLRYSFLVVVTILGVLSLCFPIPALVLNHWLRFTATGSQFGNTVTTPYDFGLSHLEFCPNITGKDLCLTIAINDFNRMLEIRSAQINSTGEQHVKEPRIYFAVLKKILKDLATIKALTITGFVLEICGFLLVMSFWRRSWKRCALARKYLSSTGWLFGSILQLAALFVGINMNRPNMQQLRDEFEIFDRTYDVHVEMKTAWGLLYTGLAAVHGIVTAVFILASKYFQHHEPKYEPLSIIEDVSLNDIKKESVKESARPLLDDEDETN